MQHSPHQQGNILFILLIALVLFVALVYAMTKSDRGGGVPNHKELSEVKAAEILDYATKIKTSYTKLRFHNQINATSLDKPNPSSPLTTNVFSPTGGGAPFIDPLKNSIDQKGWALGLDDNNQPLWFGQAVVSDIGTIEPEHVLLISIKSEEICRAINRKLIGVNDFATGEVAPDNSSGVGSFTGGTCTYCKGQPQICAQAKTAGNVKLNNVDYVFYTILLSH